MLSIPVFAEIEGVTIFRDDADPCRFYYLPKAISLIRGEDGSPMFTFLRYQFPIEREGGEPGGGYLVFTTELDVDSALLENRVKPVLQARVRSENPLATEVPEVVIAPVGFTEGEVRLIIMRDERFIKDVNLGRPSLFANNTASVAVELPSDGATLFYEALRGGGSIGAIEYNLRFPVRLPAVTIRGHVSGEEVKTATMGYTDEQITSEDTWGNEETRTKRHRSSISEAMESQGLVELEILKGNVELSDDDMESLRAFAFRAMDEFIKEHFLKGGTVETEEDRRNEWMEFLSQDITATFDLNVTYRDVINRDYNPSAQINPSFLGVSIEDVVQDIDLGNAPWFYNNLEVTVDTSLDFSKFGDIVHSVVGHLSYNEVRPDGSRIAKRKSVVFRADDLVPKEFKTRLAEVGRDTYHVDLEVNYKEGPVPSAEIASFDTTTRHLTLNVPNPGVIEVGLAAAPEAFGDVLQAIEIDFQYGDPRNNVPLAEEKVLLNAEKPETSYRRVIYAPWKQPLLYRFTYVLKFEEELQRSTTEWMETTSGVRYIRVPTPFDQQFSLVILPSVDWNEVNQLIVDLEYVDESSDLRMQKTFAFSSSAAGMKAWKFHLRDPDNRSYRYRQTLLMTNGAVDEGDWADVESDAGTLVVGNAPGGVTTVEVDPSDVDIGGTVKRVLVNLSYSDPDNDVLDTESLLFRDLSPAEWTIARADASVDEFVYTVKYYMSDGTIRTRSDLTGKVPDRRGFLFVPQEPDA